ncbi:MAG: hypothetical protein ACTHU0_21630 [Kofleriaceae bacterium]
MTSSEERDALETIAVLVEAGVASKLGCSMDQVSATVEMLTGPRGRAPVVEVLVDGARLPRALSHVVTNVLSCLCGQVVPLAQGGAA